MRLTASEVQGIASAFMELISMHKLDGELFLFGSRIDNHKRGGDIDLLWLCESRSRDKASQYKFELIAKILMRLDDQKIDVTIVSKDQSVKDPFFISVKSQLVKIA